MSTITAARSPGRRKSARPSWEEPPSLIGKILKAAFLIGICAVIAIPIWAVVATSISSESAILDSGGTVFLPTDITFQAYVEILDGGAVWESLQVTFFITGVGTAIAMVVTVLAAYGLSRPESLWHRPLLFVVLLTFLFQPSIIASYLTVQKLGLLETYWAVILPVAVNAFNLIVLRAFFMGIPRDLLDSARIDGAGEFRILWRIALPMSKAVLAVITLFTAVAYWNTYFTAILYMPRHEVQPIQVLLQSFVLGSANLPGSAQAAADSTLSGQAAAAPEALKMAVVVMTVLPILIIYPFVQRHFKKAVITGAVKG